MFVPAADPDPSTPTSSVTSPAVIDKVGNVELGTLAFWLVVAVLASGLIVLGIRSVMANVTDGKDESEDKSVVRAWLAVLLVSGLLFFGAMSFYVTDAALRNLVLGGIVASAGTVTAFYFASKSAEQTQQQLLDATFGSAGLVLPDVAGLQVEEAKRLLNSLQIKAVTAPAIAPSEKVRDTSPKPGIRVRIGEEVTLNT